MTDKNNSNIDSELFSMTCNFFNAYNAVQASSARVESFVHSEKDKIKKHNQTKAKEAHLKRLDALKINGRRSQDISPYGVSKKINETSYRR